MLKIICLGAAISCGGLNAAWTTPVAAEPAASHAESQSLASPALGIGDLVHLRSGGPLMAVDKVLGDQVIVHWSAQDGELLSGRFPIADLSAPITLPLVDPDQ
jgi:hypothetical protein